MARGNLLLLLALPAVLARHATKNIRIAPDEQDSEDAVASQEYGVGFSMTGTGLSVHDDFRLGRAATKLMMLPGPQTLAAWTKDGTACVLRGSTFAHEGSDDGQWFRQFQVEVNGINVLDVERPSPYASMQVRLDGDAQTGGDKSDEEIDNTSANGAVTLKRSDHSEWTGKKVVQTLHATACGAAMRIDSALASNFENFKKQTENVHLNLHIEKLPAGATGLLAELYDEEPLSAASRSVMREAKAAGIPAAVSYATVKPSGPKKAPPTKGEMDAAAAQRVADAHKWAKDRGDAIKGVTAVAKVKAEDEAQDWFKARDAVIEQGKVAEAKAKDAMKKKPETKEQLEVREARKQAREKDAAEKKLQTKLHGKVAPPITPMVATDPEAAPAPVAAPLPETAPAPVADAPLPVPAYDAPDASAPVVSPAATGPAPAPDRSAELPTAAAEAEFTQSCVAVEGAAVDSKWCQVSCNHNPPVCPETMCSCEACTGDGCAAVVPSPAPVVPGAAPAAPEDTDEDEPTRMAALYHAKIAESADPDLIEEGCKDDELKCTGWAAKGQCESNPEFMMKSCAFSCTRCSEGKKFFGLLRSIDDRMKLLHMRNRDASMCADGDTDCMMAAIEAAAAGGAALAKHSKLVNDTGTAFRYVTATACRDERVECAGWAASSECETNSAYMLTSCAFSCTKCNEGKPHELRSKAERKSIWYRKRHPLAKNKGKNPDAITPSPSPEPYELEASPAPNPFLEHLDPKYKLKDVGFEVHIIVGGGNREISTLLEQLSVATCNSQERQELFIHIDRCSNEAGCIRRAKAVHKAANDYKWPCGPVTVRSAPARRGSREMWFDVMELVHERYLRYGEATVLMLEDDVSVSPVYATYLELAMGMVRNESFIVGASLSPIRMNEMVEPAERWHGGSSDTIKGEKMYLSAVPSGAGGAYNNVMIGPFMRYLRLRMTYHDYDEEAKEERHNRAETGEQEGQYVAKRLQPKALEVPGAQSNFWAHSWRKHMVEFMYANGYVMAYPNLPEEKGYATSLFLDSPAKLDGSPDLRVAKIQHTLLAWDPAWRSWPVLDLQMKKSSLHAIAMSSVDFMDSKHTDWAEMISHWAQPQCLLDRSYTAHKTERPRALMYQPQSGVDSQLTAFQAATTLAVALGRTLIAPRLYSPTVCTSCSRRNMSYYFNMNAVDWSGGSVPVRAVVQTEADYVVPESNISGTVQLAEARVWSYLAHVPNTALVAVPPKVKLPTLSLLSASNWLQCNDDTLFFDGLEENDLPRSATPPLSEAVHRAHKAVTGLLKMPKKYMCMNLNSHDSLEACHNRRDTPWFQKLDKSGYQCGATNADMEEYAAKGTSMLILSAHPVLDFVKKHRKDNAHIFTSYDVEATAHHHGIRDSATISMIEQMMCANANRTLLNMFSATSRRIAEMRKEEGHSSSWFKKDDALTETNPMEDGADPDSDRWDVQSSSEARQEAQAAAESDDALTAASAKDSLKNAQDEEKELKNSKIKPSPSPAPKKHKVKPSPSPEPSPEPVDDEEVDEEEQEEQEQEQEEVEVEEGEVEYIDARASPSPMPKASPAPEEQDEQDEFDAEAWDAEPQLSKIRMTLNPKKTTLVRLGADEIENFGAPQFHGCRGFYDHCHFENVCFSGHDGMLVPDMPGVNFSSFIDENAPAGTEAMQPRLLPIEDFKNLRKVYYAKGTSYALNCAGQSLFQHDPQHYMIGFGKLFVAAHDPTVQRSMDSLIFQQCMQNSPDDWDWGKGVWSILESLGKDSQFWSPEAVDTVTLGAPSNSSAPYGKLPSAHDPIVCAKRVTMERKYAQTFLGGNVPGIVGRWRSRIDWWVSKLPKVAKAMKRHAKEAQAEADAQVDHKELSPLKVVGDCALLCTKGLKVAVLQRSEDKPSLHNVDELQALVAEYTREPMQTLVVNDKMSFDEQVAVFRSFDVLISPPTPQLTNAMFASKNSVIIEVQSAAYDTISVPNGKNFVLSFVRSSGHLPVKMGDQSSAAKSILESHGVSLAALANSSKPDRCALQVDCALTQAMDHCWGSEDTCGLHRAKAFNAVELYVDVGRIRTALEKAVALRCSCKSKELAEHLSENRTSPCPGTGDCCQTKRALAANDYFFHSCNEAILEAKEASAHEAEERTEERELRESEGLEAERFDDRVAASAKDAEGKHFGPNDFMSPERMRIGSAQQEAKGTKRLKGSKQDKGKRKPN